MAGVTTCRLILLLPLLSILLLFTVSSINSTVFSTSTAPGDRASRKEEVVRLPAQPSAYEMTKEEVVRLPAQPSAYEMTKEEVVRLPAQPSAYEMLEGFGFPRGILPDGVTSYKYRPSDGAFEVFMGGDCEFEVDGGYRLTYRRRIHGNVEGGSIRNLGGVSVRMFLFNWGIDRVVMEDADHLMFYVGPISQAFPADNFGQSPQCQRRGENGVAAAVGAGDGVAAM